MRGSVIAVLFASAVLAAAACSSDGGEERPASPDDAGDRPDDGAGPDAPEEAAPDAGPDVVDPCIMHPLTCPPPTGCGDGHAALGESCDDGNIAPGDGCSAACQIEAPWWICAFGLACVDVRACADAGTCAVPTKAAVCGDGFVDPAEACDDGNRDGGDGCSIDCKAIEQGYTCPSAAAPCIPSSTCGDGAIQGNEECDDGNSASNDGCTHACKLEGGWTCPLPGAACSATKCGDGVVAGAEECDDHDAVDYDGCSATCRLQTTSLSITPTATKTGSTTVINWTCPTAGAPCERATCGNGVREGTERCDDGNEKPYDGCSPDCQLEPSCPGGTCLAVCGDGLLFDFDGDGNGAKDEACDDGNTRDGDGCSKDCTIEPGYTCSTVVADIPPYLDLPIVLRDFKYWNAADPESHPDFERYLCLAASTGLTLPVLGSAPRVPLFAQPLGDPSCVTPDQLTDALDFTDWYADVMIGGHQRGKRIDGTQLRLTVQRGGAYVFDSDLDQPYKTLGGFFPVEGKGWGDQGAAHNFSFTTELRYWFTYDAATSPELTFSGDDDVWVFVNGQLVVDLGGTHQRLERSIVLDAARAASLGLANGRLYEVALFHAERHTQASNFKLTLSSYIRKISSCAGTCGDGVRTGDEECDEGAANTSSGAYASCGDDCKLAPHCGDATKTSPPEQCDDGTNRTAYTESPSNACGPGCRTASFCGDARVQAEHEQCDRSSDNVGGYGKCAPDCSLGPRCGDGVVQADNGEACDNGFNLTDYLRHPDARDCAPSCTKPRSCGDGTVDFPFETCDEGPANTDDGPKGSCTTACTIK